MTQRLFLSALAAATLALAGCGQNPSAQQPAGRPVEELVASTDPIPVLASTSIVADIVGQIGGERVSVSTLVPIGGDTHSFEPTPQDIARAIDAALIFVSGAGYEEFLERLLDSAGSKAQVVELSRGITLRELSEGEGHAEGEEHAEDEAHEHEELDPHTWTDPNNIKYWTATIAEALSSVDAAGAETYRANAERYDQQLTELDAWIAEQFAQVPADQRLLVTDHAVFGYMADRYGLRQVGALLPGTSSAAEPSAQDLAALQDEIRALGVKVIFVGEVVNQGLAQRLADDTGVRLVTVLTESLAPAGAEGATYLDYMR
jgi:manganese/iron transport system substrate-binding protein